MDITKCVSFRLFHQKATVVVADKQIHTRHRPLKSITSFGEGALVNAWFNINSFEKKAHLEKIDEDGMLASVGLGT